MDCAQRLRHVAGHGDAPDNENIHVAIPGTQVIDSVCQRILANNRDAGRRDRLLRYRMQQIRAELGQRRDGDQILTEFAALGPVPSE